MKIKSIVTISRTYVIEHDALEDDGAIKNKAIELFTDSIREITLNFSTLYQEGFVVESEQVPPYIKLSHSGTV